MLNRIKGPDIAAWVPGPSLWQKLSRHGPLVKKTVLTVVSLAVIYYGVTTLVAWITAPRINMLMSPVAGRIAIVAEPAKVAAIERKVTYTGSVAPHQEVTVYPRVEGWVQKFNLYEGDHVRRGEVIARLDRAELGAAAQQAKAMVAQAEDGIRQMEAGLARARGEVAKAVEEKTQADEGLVEARAGLNQAKADLEYAKAEYGRDEILVKRGAIAQAAFDLRKAQFEVAQEKVVQAKARIAQMEAGIRRAVARQDEAAQMLKQAEAALSGAHARLREAQEEFQRRSVVLNYTDVEAPITGRVSKRYIYAGILVKAGMPIVDLQDLSKVRIQAKVAERDAHYVRVGTEAAIHFPSLPAAQQERRARVTTVFPQLDPLTRTATVELLVDNPGEVIKPDMYAVVDLILEKKERALLIPRMAVLEGLDKQSIVYVTDGVVAMQRPVKLGIADGYRVEVLDGVKEGEMVVWKGQRSLSDGAQVSVVPAL